MLVVPSVIRRTLAARLRSEAMARGPVPVRTGCRLEHQIVGVAWLRVQSVRRDHRIGEVADALAQG